MVWFLDETYIKKFNSVCESYETLTYRMIVCKYVKDRM